MRNVTTNEGKCTEEIKAKIAIEKIALCKRNISFTACWIRKRLLRTIFEVCEAEWEIECTRVDCLENYGMWTIGG